MHKKALLGSMILLPLAFSKGYAQSTQGVVNATALNVRMGASTSYNVKFVLYKGEKVNITNSYNGWYEISTTGSKSGWVNSKYIKLEENTNTKKVSVSSLNMRKGPSTNYGIITVLKRGCEVKVISESNGWSKIICDSKTGYVVSSYLTDKEDISTKTKYVTAYRLNIRSGEGTNYKVIGIYKYKDEVKVVSLNGDWAKIIYQNGYAYVSNNYLSDNKPSNSSDNNDNESNKEYTTYENLSYSFDTMVNYEYRLAQNGYNKINSSLSTATDSKSTYINATKEDLKKYLNPSTFGTNANGKLQFLRIDKYRDAITASNLNSFFDKYCPKSSVFKNKGQSFIDAAKKYNLDVSYLVAASMVETGYGTSQLSQGVYKTNEKGQKIKVYNFFGISAYDGTALVSASNYAYKKGWTTIDKTIDGSAQWLSSNYIHNSKYNQNTLYKMRWIYNVGHQYATDVTWAYVISKVMNNVMVYYNNSTSLEFLIPKYK